jgi:hypothetical protein
MGNYNPRAPYILGEEWVPIRNELVTFSPGVNTIERGHGFTLATARQVRDGRYYIDTLPPEPTGSQVSLIGVYPAGSEDQTGPISSVIIPCNNGAITGTGMSLFGSDAPATVAAALASPVDSAWVRSVFSSGTPQDLSMFFAVNQYPHLADKRILNVSLIYAGVVSDGIAVTPFVAPFVNPDPFSPLTTLSLRNDSASQVVNYFPATSANTGSLDKLSTTINPVSLNVFDDQEVVELNIGDVNAFWSLALGPSGTTNRMPWRYVDLQRLEASAANRLHIHLRVVVPTTANGTGTDLRLSYVALRVTYCEEKRVIYGGNNSSPYKYSANIIPMRDLVHNADPILPAGQYVVTLSSVNPGDVDNGQGTAAPFPTLNALRELYQIPPHPGLDVNIPFPLEDHLGETFSSTVTHILPQLSLHASGGTLTEPHVYGRQAAAQVYGVNTATQDIYDDISGVAASYPQVRFYARRFGDTTIPLTLTGVGGLAGSTVSITAADFDLLAEILDGWKEVTLRFASPPSMGAVAGDPAWTWSATSETSGNRWEIMGACAPAISGVPGNLFSLVPAPNQLGTATYQPPSGDTVELTWMPQGVGSPYVTGATADATCDAVLIFSQDPPTVTGVGLTQLSQTVTGIGLDCGSLPCCIPSGIGYQRIAWSATSLPSTGFGAYELQRWDHLQADFETIMLATNPALVGFNDYEARVGINSVYRIRTLNVLNFAGAWSAQVTGAPPIPGVTGGCDDQTGALIFTSNADQSGGSNAAYVMQWERDPAEEFNLPEAGQVQFQPMYGRDGSVAFHGTERGLEAFTRTVLLQAAAIDPIRLADAATLRDLAWADLPYVCVRDEIGDRWFANVRVPQVSVRHNRTKYMARIEITETTVCPFAVDP